MRVYPVKGYSVTIYLDDMISQQAAPQVSLLDDPVKIVSSRLGNRLRLQELQNWRKIKISDKIEFVLCLIG